MPITTKKEQKKLLNTSVASMVLVSTKGMEKTEFCSTRHKCVTRITPLTMGSSYPDLVL